MKEDIAKATGGGTTDGREEAVRPLPVPNARQTEAIGVTAALFGADPEVEFLTWRVVDPAGFLREGQEAEGLHVEFLYRVQDDHPECRPGREVTVFAEDGTVLTSQDFG